MSHFLKIPIHIFAAIGLIASILGIYLFFTAFQGTKEFIQFQPSEGKNLPALDEWHQKSPVHFLWVHGMAHHPLGTKEESVLPELAGFANYEHLLLAFSNWESEAMWSGEDAFWLSAPKKFYEKYYEKKGVPDYAKTREEIADLLTSESRTEFLEEYCERAGYELNREISADDIHPITYEGWPVIGF